MVILGINYFFHDSSACIVKDGNLVVSIEEERLNRHKHTTSFPHAAIRKCLDVAGLDYEDVDRIAVSIKVSKDWGRKVLYGLRHINRVKPFVKHELWNAYFKQSSLKAWYEQSFSGISRSPPIDFIPHHSCHADGSFLVSPFEEAAILSIDGAGEWSTSFLGYGKGNSITRFGESYFPMSLGSFYEAATEFCGFRPNYDEGKTMGLAPMGDPDRFHSIVKELVRVDEEGGLHFDLSYFNHQFWGRRRCGAKLIDALGQPRAMDGEFEPHHMDVAAAFQRVLEDTALELCSILHRKTSARHLVIAGGVALNSVMNGKIVRDSEFDDIYVMPAAGDNGTAIGAAFVSLVEASGAERTYVHDDPYVGNEYSSEEITAIVKECKLESEVNDDVESIGADLLRDGEIIGWFQGRMEIGPRALGNRSILANPTLPHMKDKINADVKHREAYRPFAPSSTVEDQSRYFEDLGENPFMLKVCDVLEEHKQTLPAVTHVDGSARLQTVNKETNPRYHRLIRKFGERSGVPVVLNTSFNIMGEPIVESPIDAIRCFFSTGIDALVLGDHVIRKKR